MLFEINKLRLRALLLTVAVALSSLLILFCPSVANADGDSSRRYTAVQDADISSASSTAKDNVYGLNDVVTSSTSSLRRAILQFDVDGIEELEAIESVQLVMYVESLTSENFDSLVVRVEEASDANGWSQSTVTWNNRKNEYGIDYSINVDILSSHYDANSGVLIIDLDPAILCEDYVTDFMDPDAEEQLITLSYAGVKMTVCSTEGAEKDTKKFAPYLLVNHSYSISGESNDPAFGSVTPSSSAVTAGGSVTYSVVPSEGYYVFAASLNGHDVMNRLVPDGSGGYTIEVGDIAEDTLLSVTFISEGTLSYNISVSDTENGSVTADSYKVMGGQKVKYTITPDDHYKISRVLVNGNDYTSAVSGGILELTVEGNQTVHVIFTEAESKYTLSVNTADGGVAYFGDDASVTSVTKWSSEWPRETVVLNVIPAVGYKIGSVSANGVAQAINGYQLSVIGSSVSESVEYEVRFVKDTGFDGSRVYPTGDTMLYSSSSATKDTVYGNEPTALVKSSSSERLYVLSFDLEQITDFSAVTLNIYNNFTGSGWGKYELGIYALTQAVDDSSTTWNSLSLDGMIYENDDGIRVSDRGTLVATVESGSLSQKSWLTVDVTSIINIARISGIDTISFLVINSDIGSTSSSPIPFETKESNLLVNGSTVRPHLSVSEATEDGTLLPAQPEYSVTVSGARGVRINGEERSSGVYERYTPIVVDLSDIPSDKRVAQVTVNGSWAELVDGKLYLNGYDCDVEVSVTLTDIHRVDVTCDEKVEVSVKSLMLSESEGAVITFKMKPGYKAQVTVNGVIYYYVNNCILLDGIYEDTVVIITAVEI